MSQTPVELKGSNFTLSVIHLHSMQPAVIGQALAEKIAQAPAFLKDAPVVINVADLSCDADWSSIHQVLTDSGLRVVGVSGCQHKAMKTRILQSGLALLNEGKRPGGSKTRSGDKSINNAENPPPLDDTQSGQSASDAVKLPANDFPVKETATPYISKTLCIDTPVRSGQRIYAPQADLIVTSQVSAGAELIADGNIHVYGMMRGRVLAGANGDKDAQIFASHLAAELISIAGVYWLSDQIPDTYYAKAVRLRLADGALAIESLN